MRRDAKKQSLALLVACALVVTVLAVSISTLQAQSAQSGSSDKPSAAAPPAAPSSSMVWINTDTGVYHKQGTRWYGKTKHGKYMLEADAIKAGYKPAK
jgi:hypothetical protein